METSEKLRSFRFKVNKEGAYVQDLDADTQERVGIYKLNFETSPNDGIYEMTIKLNSGKLEFSERTISRTNKYGDQPKCVSGKMPHLRKYCFCLY